MPCYACILLQNTPPPGNNHTPLIGWNCGGDFLGRMALRACGGGGAPGPPPRKNKPPPPIIFIPPPLFFFCLRPCLAFRVVGGGRFVFFLGGGPGGPRPYTIIFGLSPLLSP